MKLLHNITFIIENNTEESWLAWMKESVLPQVINAGVLDEYKFLKIIGQDESQGVRYAVQFFITGKTKWNTYAATLEPVIFQNLRQTFQDRVLHFATSMQVLQEDLG